MRVFGKATDFYRLRVLKMSEDSEPDLSWEPDILLRRPPAVELETDVWYQVQAVSLDSEEAFSLKRFPSAQAAIDYRDKVEERLAEWTKLEFEERFSSFNKL